MYEFDVKRVTKEVVDWIRDFFDKNGNDCKAVVAISGGKDSSVTAALLVEALGKERVYGILLPNGEQEDIYMSYKLINFLGIDYTEINIKDIYELMVKTLKKGMPDDMSEQTRINLAPRIRMAITYGVSQSMNGRVANTGNLSEDWVGYSTRYGDGAGDFSPLANLTVAEVRQVGTFLGLPDDLVYKVPIDGLSGLTDEDNLGFTYGVLDKYIRTGVCEDSETKALIDRRHRANKFKLEPMPSYPNTGAPIKAED